MNTQQLSSLARQVGAGAISGAYAGLVAAGHTKGIPAAVDAVIIGFGPAIIALEHYLSDPSTGNPTSTTTATITASPTSPPPTVPPTNL